MRHTPLKHPVYTNKIQCSSEIFRDDDSANIFYIHKNKRHIWHNIDQCFASMRNGGGKFEATVNLVDPETGGGEVCTW